MKILQFLFVLISFLVVMVVYLFNEIKILKKNHIENFNNNKIIEHTTNTDSIKALINEQYNMDIDAIRNLGAISKSLLEIKFCLSFIWSKKI